MSTVLKLWGAYVRATKRWPIIATIVPFIPVVALWSIVANSGMFPRAFFPAPADVARTFVALTYKGILPDYLQDSLIRLLTGAAIGVVLGIPLGLLIGSSKWAHRVCWPVLLFFQAIGDIAWLPILLIWFGFGLTTMTFVIVYTVLFPIVLNTVLGVEFGASRPGACRSKSRRVAYARALGGDVTRCTAQHHHGASQRARLRLARADRRRNHRRHERHRIHDV